VVTAQSARIVVNGVEHEVGDSGDQHLLEWLRETLGLTGAKYGCGEAACGACSVLVDGALTRACVVPVEEVVGCSVVTIEGLAHEGALHAVQRAFVESGAMQCGFCTPGMVVAAVALLDAHADPSPHEIEAWMAPNLCRCCTYPRIVAAIQRSQEPCAPEPCRTTADQLEPALLARPSAPWDLTDVEARDYFSVLGDGLVVVAPPAPAAPGMWARTGGAWLHVDAGGAVVAFTGKVEVGQGTARALRIVVAEELGLSPDAVRLVMGDTDVCPFDVGTFASLSMPTAAVDLRRAAAAACAVLGRLGLPAPGTRRVEMVVEDPVVIPPTKWRVAGHSWTRGDPDVVTGTAEFVSDLRRPRMLHGKVLHPPTSGARLRSIDIAPVRQLAGVTVVVEGDFVAVAAASRRLAGAAIEAIRAEWDEPAAVSEADLESHLRSHFVSDDGWPGPYSRDVGDVDAALSAAPVRLARTYTTAYIAHAPLEPRAALAEWDGERLTVWTGTQQPFATRRALAEALGVEEERVRVIAGRAGGAFGGKHEPDVAIAAARLARAANAPVQVHWTRDEEFTWAYFRPAAIVDVEAGVDADGTIGAWQFSNINSGNAGIDHAYDIPNTKLRFQPAESPLRQGSYRALAATANNFARESFFDELAAELRIDPLALRLAHLRDDRLIDVLQAATNRFGWHARLSEAGVGIGLAVGLEKAARVATCVRVRVDDGRVELLGIVTAVECGAIIDPDNLANQIEGATIMGLGGALFESVHFDGGHILNPRFSQYRVPRFTDVPQMAVVLVDRPDLPSAGAGETPMITIAPALANAIFSATGSRVRCLPLLENNRLRST
jgi:isoquinoline 1-oxidoreductase